MGIPVQKFKQNNQEYLSFIVPFETLENMSKVLVYQEHSDGYQRKPNDVHINKIKKFVVEHLDNFKLPTSIILGIDKKDSNLYLQTSDEGDELILKDLEGKPFRIVDGQHRILGLAKALDFVQDDNEKNKIRRYPFHVIAIITPENSRSIELDIFVDINSKGKKVSTDLAELARYNYRIKEKTISKDISSLSEHIAMKTSQQLREEAANGVWNYAIKFDIHSKTNVGIIGVSAFRKSITGIIQKYLNKTEHGLMELDDQELIDGCNEQASIITSFITKCWNESVKVKWPSCFDSTTIEDDFENVVKIYFSKKYYIQKPLGAKSINRLIENSIVATENLEEAFANFDQIIQVSKVKSITWKVGGIFSGLNSEGGFKKIREMISNQREIPKV